VVALCLQSFLVEISAIICAEDEGERTASWWDRIVDKTGAKGTGGCGQQQQQRWQQRWSPDPACPPFCPANLQPCSPREVVPVVSTAICPTPMLMRALAFNSSAQQGGNTP